MWMGTVRKAVPQQKMRARHTGRAAEEELVASNKEEKWAGEFIYTVHAPHPQPVDRDGMVAVNLIRSLLGGTVHIDSATARRQVYQVYQVEYLKQLGTTFVSMAGCSNGSRGQGHHPCSPEPASCSSPAFRLHSPTPPVVVAHSTFLSALIASPSGAHLGKRISRPASPMTAAQDGAEVGHMLAQVHSMGHRQGSRPPQRQRTPALPVSASEPALMGPMAKPLGLAGDRR